MAYAGYSNSYRIGQQALDDSKGKLGHLGAIGLSEFGPLGVAVGEGLGALFDWSTQDLFDEATRYNRYVPGTWYKTVNGREVAISQEEMDKKQEIPPGARFVPDPRWAQTNRAILPTTPLDPLQRIVPILPIRRSEEREGFDPHNYDPSHPAFVIFDDKRKHNSQPHPSSKYQGNAAFPNAMQGFCRY